MGFEQYTGTGLFLRMWARVFMVPSEGKHSLPTKRLSGIVRGQGPQQDVVT